MKYQFTFFLSVIITANISLANTLKPKTDTEAAQNFAIALKQGEELTELIALFKKISEQSPLKNWANQLAVEQFGHTWLVLTKKPN
ncbi:MAG: hypothetical protein IPM57_12055 [Oligoflexia bacterium]|nr:hypothetical protein [Oligoflexia bacterium]